jgi:integrase
MIHIKKDYTKSKRDSDIPLMLNETNDLLKNYLKEKKEGLLFDFGYTNTRVLISRVSDKAKIKTKPEGKSISIHDFRRSCATYFLSKGYNIDFVKARLGHKPSSTVIDRYVSYLGLNEQEAITMSQNMDYGELKNSYQEAIERIKVLDENHKEMEKKLNKLQEQMINIRKVAVQVIKEREES